MCGTSIDRPPPLLILSASSGIASSGIESLEVSSLLVVRWLCRDAHPRTAPRRMNITTQRAPPSSIHGSHAYNAPAVGSRTPGSSITRPTPIRNCVIARPASQPDITVEATATSSRSATVVPLATGVCEHGPGHSLYARS